MPPIAWRKLNSGNPQSYEDWYKHFGESLSGAGALTDSSPFHANVPEPASALLWTLALLIFYPAVGRLARR
jgi:hypothetical protein